MSISALDMRRVIDLVFGGLYKHFVAEAVKNMVIDRA
jgi:hypothetical protein